MRPRSRLLFKKYTMRREGASIMCKLSNNYTITLRVWNITNKQK